MKKAILSAMILLTGCMAKTPDDIIIEGQVTNVKDGYVVNLFREDGRVGTTVGRDTIEGRKFYFKIKPESELDKLSIFIPSPDFPSMSRQLYATPGSTIRVNGDDVCIYTWEVQSDVKEQKEYDEYLSVTKDLLEKIQQMQAEVSALWSVVDSSTATDEEKKAAKDKITLLHKQSDSLFMEVYAKEIALMKEKPVTKVWMEKLYGVSNCVNLKPDCPFKEDAKALYERLSEAEKQSGEGKEIAVNLFPPVTVKIGDDMADADLYDLEGNEHHLAELKGKYILLDFWSSGCGPCVMAIPEMGELQEKYADKLAVVSLSSDTEKRWREASAEHPMTWKNWSDKQQTAGLYAKYGVRGIPHYVLISPEGKVVDSWSGYGKGSLLRKIRSYMYPKPAMSVEKAEGCVRVNYPDYKENKTGSTLEIKQVECTSKATILHFIAYYIPNYWIRISTLASLSTPDGKQYKALKAEGITLGEKFFMPESGEAEFSLTFQPLPMDAASFTFKEGEGEADWQIVDVKLMK